MGLEVYVGFRVRALGAWGLGLKVFPKLLAFCSE